MLPSLSLGPLVIPTGPFLAILGVWLALWLVERVAVRLRQDGVILYGLAVTGLVVGILAARLSFVALYWPAYRAAPLSIIWPLTSGYLPWVGVAAGVAALFFYGRYRRLLLRPTLDALTPGLLALLLTVSLVDFAAGPGYGRETAVPWAVTAYGISRHPVQLYELGLALAALLLWWQLARRPHFAGQLFLSGVGVYAGGRLFVEAFRANSWLVADGYRGVQIVAWAVLLAAIFLWEQWRARQAPEVDAAGSEQA
jgi:phosphatidylglycerol---prolipoprotein diacylglyceryl transferase